MKKLIIIIILLAAAGGGAYYFFFYNQKVEKPQVVQADISRGDIVEGVKATGSLEAIRVVQVGSQVSGIVKNIYVDFNYIVKTGQLIAEIDPTLLQVQVDIQQANVAQREGDIANQNVQLVDAQTQQKRQQDLYNKGLTTKQALEQADLTVKTRQASIESAQKQLISANAALDQAKLNVSYCKIYAPVDGVILDRLVDIGQTVQASTTTPQFFKIATDLTKLKLSAGVDEAEIGKVRTGMEVDFTVESYGQTPFLGTVSAVRLNASTNQNVVTYPVWIDVQNNDLRLRPSMTASAVIVISKARDVLRVPNSATRFRPTTEIYTALGLTPPAAGQGTRLAQGGGAGGPGGGGGAAGGADAAGGAQPNRGGGGGGAQPNAAAQPTTPGGAAQPAQGGQSGQGNFNRQRSAQGTGQPGQPGQQMGQNRQPGTGGGTGFGGGARPGLTDAERQAMMERFNQGAAGGNNTGRGGRGGNRNGRGGGGNGQQFFGRGGQAANAGGDTTPMTERNAQKIDELFAPLQTQETRGQVWIWNEAGTTDKEKLHNVQVRLGVTDGTFSELLSGDLQIGQKVVTGVLLPLPKASATSGNPLLQQNQMRGMGGMQPGGGGPGGGGRGGGGGGRGGGN